METFFRLRTRERRLQFMYLLAAVVVLSALISGIAFRNYSYPRFESQYLAEQINQQEQILKAQKERLPLLDSAYRAIIAYEPRINAVFVEVDIEEHLNDIRRLSNPQTAGIQFRSFAQIADFYKMMYLDKKITWNKQTNINLFRKQLDDCSVGLVPGPAAAGTPVAPTTTP
jgi:hypothetical protein